MSSIKLEEAETEDDKFDLNDLEAAKRLGLVVIVDEESRWALFQRRRAEFRVPIEEEEKAPFFGAVQLAFESRSGRFVHRVFGRTKFRGRVANVKDLEALLDAVFEETLPCLGFYGDAFKTVEDEKRLVSVDFPFPRHIAFDCQLAYRVEEDMKPPSVSELLGIGLCESCVESAKCIDEDKEKRPQKCHVCPTCGKSYKAVANLRSHMNRHTGEKPFKCGECNFVTSSSNSLDGHARIHLRQRGLERTVNDTPLTHECDVCGRKYHSATYLRQHVRSQHEGVVRHRQCDICGMVFTNNTTLRRHKGRQHPTDPTLVCGVCGHVCPDKTQFKRHSRVHADPALMCRFCGKALKSKETLEAHERSHTGENPYECDQCNYKCKAGTVLNKHKVAKHGIASKGLTAISKGVEANQLMLPQQM